MQCVQMKIKCNQDNKIMKKQMQNSDFFCKTSSSFSKNEFFLQLRQQKYENLKNKCKKRKIYLIFYQLMQR